MFGGFDILFGSVLLALGLGGLAASVSLSVAAARKYKQHKVNAIQSALRRQKASKYKNPNRIKGLVKKLYKVQVKSANITESLKAKLETLELKGAKYKKIQNLKSRISRLDYSEKKSEKGYNYSEKLNYGKDKFIDLPTNSILSFSKSIVDDYKLALEPTQQSKRFENEFSNRRVSGGVYPMELSIKNSAGELVAHLSDVSSQRYFEFTQRLMAKLYSDIENEDAAKIESYQITMVDTAVRSTTKSSQMEFLVTTADECQEALEKMNHFMISGFLGFDRSVRNVDFKKLVDVYNYEGKVSKSEPNKIYYKRNSSLLKSDYLNRKFNIFAQKSEYFNKEKSPFITTLMLNGSELVRFSADNKELLVLMQAHIAAYAFVMSYERHQLSGGYNNMQLVTTKLNTSTLNVETISTNELVDFYKIYSIYKSEPGFMESVNEIAQERGMHIDFTAIKDPSVSIISKDLSAAVIKPVASFIQSNLKSTEKEFITDIKRKETGDIIYTTKITNDAFGTYKMNLEMCNQSRTVQLTYFYKLMFEAYTISHKEMEETNKFSPVTISTEFERTSAHTSLPKNKTKTYSSLEMLKTEIKNYAKDSLNIVLTDEEFDKQSKDMENEIFSSSSFTF